MDATFLTDEGIFNYRVAAVMISRGRVLAMRDDDVPYYYLPGGRVRLHETAEDAVRRELREELSIDAEIIRPLWMHQNFFTDTDRKKQQRCHELCLYFLVDASNTGLEKYGERFILNEDGTRHIFEWFEFGRLRTERVYPLFLRDRISNLPKHLDMITDFE